MVHSVKQTVRRRAMYIHPTNRKERDFVSPNTSSSVLVLLTEIVHDPTPEPLNTGRTTHAQIFVLNVHLSMF